MQPAQGRRTKLAECADAMNCSWPESVSQSFNPCQSRDARGPGDAALLVGGLLKGLLLAPRQPGLILFCQLGSFWSRRRVFLLDWHGGNRSFAGGRRFVFLILLLGFLCHRSEERRVGKEC